MLGLQIPGGAFADLLMVQEFVHNFGEALDLGKNKTYRRLHFCFITSALLTDR